MASGGLLGAMMSSGDDDEESEDDSSSVETEYLSDAYDAIGKDRKAFMAAMRSAIRACQESYDEEE